MPYVIVSHWGVKIGVPRRVLARVSRYFSQHGHNREYLTLTADFQLIMSLPGAFVISRPRRSARV